MAVYKQLEKRIATILARSAQVRLAYLFGSRVNGVVGTDSDYDIAVLVEDTYDVTELRARLAHELALALGTAKVDLVVLNLAPIELQYVAIAEGRPVYSCSEAVRVEYEARVMSLYGDYLLVLREQRRDILRGGSNAARVQWYREALARTERTLVEIRGAQDKKPC